MIPYIPRGYLILGGRSRCNNDLVKLKVKSEFHQGFHKEFEKKKN